MTYIEQNSKSNSSSTFWRSVLATQLSVINSDALYSRKEKTFAIHSTTSGCLVTYEDETMPT